MPIKYEVYGVDKDGAQTLRAEVTPRFGLLGMTLNKQTAQTFLEEWERWRDRRLRKDPDHWMHSSAYDPDQQTVKLVFEVIPQRGPRRGKPKVYQVKGRVAKKTQPRKPRLSK